MGQFLFVGGATHLCLLLCAVCCWPSRCGRGGRRERCLTPCTTSSGEAKRRMSAICAHHCRNRDNAGPFGICSMLSHNACSGGERASRAPQIWGSGVDATIDAQRQNSLVHTGSPILVSDRSRRALRAIRFSLYIYRDTRLQQAERHPVSEPAAHMCVRAGRAAVRSQTGIRHRNTSPCRGCSSTRPRERVAASCRPAGYLHTGCAFITNRLVR